MDRLTDEMGKAVRGQSLRGREPASLGWSGQVSNILNR